MTNKELLIQEIETLSPDLLTEALDFIRFIKASRAREQIKLNNDVEINTVKDSTAKNLLEFAGTWEGNDIRECLQLVHNTRMPLEP
jgi:hypothetical protein